MSISSLRSSKKGFSLLELIITLLVIGIVAAIAAFTYTRVISNSTNTTASSSFEGVIRNARAIATSEGRTFAASADVAIAAGEANPTVTFTPLAGTVPARLSQANVGGKTCTANVTFSTTAQPTLGTVTCT
jgi:prepilin-type N-terminal cleavage/methylation domain-containing protein